MEHWYTPITEDLEKVDAIIDASLRSDRPELQDMCDYITTSKGKKIRPSVCVLAHYACGGSKKEEIRRLASAFELIHVATLIHDDINDRSEIRRGRRTVHKEYTVSKAVILGDFMFAMGFGLAGSTDKKIIDTIVNASTAMAESEFIQKEFEHRPAVTEKDYMKIIRGKTAMPIFAGARTGAYLAGADAESIDAVSSFALDVGLAFQIVDDVLDMIGDHISTGKKVGIDIAEGKPTLPVIYAMSDPENGAQIRKIFEKEEPTDADLDEAMRLIKATDALDRCMKKANDIVDGAIPLLSCLGGSVHRDSLEGLARYVVARDR
jgi:octaprenyl-diphosphate synthase